MKLDRRSLLRLAAAGAVAPLLVARRRAPPGRRRRAAAPLALVTADHDGYVAVVDLDRRRVARRIATLDGPRSVEARAGAGALVGHAAEGAVTLLDGSPLRVRRVLRGFGEPRYAAIAPDGAHAFVTDSAHGELAVVDLRRGRVARRLEVGAGARHLTLDPAGRTLWIALGSTAATLVVVDVADPLAPRVVRRDRAAVRRARRRLLAERAARLGDRRPDGRASRCTAPTAAGRPAVLAADAAPQHVTFGPRRGVRRQRRGPLADRPRPRRRPRAAARRASRWAPTTSRAAATACSRRRSDSGELTVLDDAGRVRWAVTIAGAAHDACVL